MTYFLQLDKDLKLSAVKVLRNHESLPTDIWNPGLVKNQLIPIHKEKDEFKLILHIIPSPYGFEWNNYKKLVFSLRNYLSLKSSHKIGHAFIEIQKNGIPIIATGMTGETNYQVIYDLLLKKIGLDFLIQKFRGRLETSDFVLKDIKKHQKLERIASYEIPIDHSQYKSCKKHLQRFCTEGLYRDYGLTLSPFKDKGASCTSFAVSFLNIANLLKTEHKKEWKRKVLLPTHTLKSNGKKIGILRLLFILLKKNDNSLYTPIEFWDPDLMYHWIKQNAKKTSK